MGSAPTPKPAVKHERYMRLCEPSLRSELMIQARHHLQVASEVATARVSCMPHGAVQGNNSHARNVHKVRVHFTKRPQLTHAAVE